MSNSYPLRELITRVATTGRVEAIVVRPQRGVRALSIDAVQALPGQGLVGDRRAKTTQTTLSARKREITLIQAEHVPLIATWSGVAQPLDVTRLRRNLVISGVNLLSMKSPFAEVKLHWQLGDEVCIEVTGPCDPCSKMAAELGVGGYNAMRGHGGVTAMLISGGIIRVGDTVRLKQVIKLATQ